MREFVIVGRPNSGKTMFALSFAKYLGSKTVDVTFRTYDGLMTCRHFTLDEAKRELCGMALHKTRSLQSIVLKLPVGKTVANFKLTDTCGLTTQIHHEEAIRRGMVQTLSILRYADFILHTIDVSDAKNVQGTPENIDTEIYNYGRVRHNYAMLVNKMDLPSAEENYKRIASLFTGVPVIPVSGLYGNGFKEVKACVARNI